MTMENNEQFYIIRCDRAGVGKEFRKSQNPSNQVPSLESCE